MTTRLRRATPRRPVSVPPLQASVGELQKGWWAVALVATGIGALGFQTLPPARRLSAIEVANVRQDSVNSAQDRRNREQDSVLEVHQRAERLALDSINQQLGQLLAGQCVKERDRMARLLYDCARRTRP